MRFCAVFLLTAGAMWAQAPSASLVGRVSDATGSVVPSVEITVTNVGANQAFRGASNAVGDYTIPYLNPGRYTLEAKAQGFRIEVDRDA